MSKKLTLLGFGLALAFAKIASAAEVAPMDQASVDRAVNDLSGYLSSMLAGRENELPQRKNGDRINDKVQDIGERFKDYVTNVIILQDDGWKKPVLNKALDLVLAAFQQTQSDQLFQKAQTDFKKAQADFQKAQADFQKAGADFKSKYADLQSKYPDLQKAQADFKSKYEDLLSKYPDLQKAPDFKKAQADLQKAQADFLTDFKKAQADFQSKYNDLLSKYPDFKKAGAYFETDFKKAQADFKKAQADFKKAQADFQSKVIESIALTVSQKK